FSSRRRHTSCYRDWSSDVCSSDLDPGETILGFAPLSWVLHGLQMRRAMFPEGPLRIAQPFKAGSTRSGDQVPKGRLKSCMADSERLHQRHKMPLRAQGLPSAAAVDASRLSSDPWSMLSRHYASST